MVKIKKMAGMPASMTFSNESTISFWVVSSSRNDRAFNAVLLLLLLLIVLMCLRLVFSESAFDFDEEL